MKDTEKAKELLGCENCQYRTVDCDSNNRCIYMNTIMEMAAWKEHQLIEKACKWLNEVVGDNQSKYVWYDSEEGFDGITEDLVEDFKKAMEECMIQKNK